MRKVEYYYFLTHLFPNRCVNDLSVLNPGFIVKRKTLKLILNKF